MLRFLAAKGMLNLRYARLLWRYLWRRLLTPAGRRWRTDGFLFFGRRLEIQIAPRGRVEFGRFVWIGDGTKIRCHEGEVIIGEKTVIGQECTISAYQHVRIGEQCVIADRAMFIDFDHGVVEVERPIRVQGIYKRDVHVGSNVWIGYGACILRGVRIGDNSIIGTNSVVTRDVPANAVVGGVPARVLRMRKAPTELRWRDPVEPDPAAETTLGPPAGAPARYGPSVAGQASAPFREEHRELLVQVERIRELAGAVGELPEDEREARIREVLEFISGTLVPHAEAEEAVMYPEVGRILGAAEAADPMIYDHHAIRERAGLLEAADRSDAGALRELLYGLHALIVVHFEKEEEIYLPLLERQPEDVARSVFERMEAHGHHHHGKSGAG